MKQGLSGDLAEVTMDLAERMRAMRVVFEPAVREIMTQEELALLETGLVPETFADECCIRGVSNSIQLKCSNSRETRASLLSQAI